MKNRSDWSQEKIYESEKTKVDNSNLDRPQYHVGLSLFVLCGILLTIFIMFFI